ncbi:uncharacterized protein LOC34619547 [Cyclospora cayetanensis]|uniref:Uncharacterized protein LOC34619547 n=1 Tax=Cyclospora cayetanensis TaxID=88456 RepID=A0A6P6RX73_9EIME|nr:uncharacterized protein LOC34619547 [Cyclospora cayetanensis]
MRFGKDLPQSSPGSRPCEAIAESSQAAQLDDEARSAGAAAAAALAAPSEAIGDAPAAADLLQADDFEHAESLYDLSDAAAEAFLEHQLKRGAAAVTATTQSNRQFQLLLQHMPEGPKAAAAAISAQRSSNPWERSSDVQQHPQRLSAWEVAAASVSASSASSSSAAAAAVSASSASSSSSSSASSSSASSAQAATNDSTAAASESTSTEEAAAAGGSVSFKDLGVLASLLEALKAQGYRIPTPVQAAALPVTLAEHDAVIQAKSGTGKTVAFAVHALQRLLLAAAAWETPPATAAADCSPALPAADRAASEPAAAGGFFGFALVIAPSRELATQTAAEMRSLAQHIPHIHIGVCCLLGGFALNVSKQELSKRPQIIVATPGRLLLLLKRRRQQKRGRCLCAKSRWIADAAKAVADASAAAAAAAATAEAAAAATAAPCEELSEGATQGRAAAADAAANACLDAENTATFAASAEAAAVAAAALCSCSHNVPLQQQLKQELRVVILDEADLLLDTFFRPQTKEILDRVLHPSAQLTAYSATFAPQLLHYLEEELLQDAERLLPVSEADTPQEIQQSVIKECSEQRLSLQPRALWRVMLCASRVRFASTPSCEANVSSSSSNTGGEAGSGNASDASRGSRDGGPSVLSSGRAAAAAAPEPQQEELMELKPKRSEDHAAPPPVPSGIIYGLMEVPPAEQSGLRVLSIKLQMLLDVISRIYFRQAVIFVNEPLVGAQVAQSLRRFGITSVYTSGRLPQRERNKRLAALKQFQCRVMVCSDLMSRGIDAIGIDLVINFNLPMDKDTFLHRGGRAGRYGSWGVCVSIASSDEADSYRYIAASYGITLHALQDIEQLQAVLRPEVRALRAPANAAATTLSRAANAHASAAAASDEVVPAAVERGIEEGQHEHSEDQPDSNPLQRQHQQEQQGEDPQQSDSRRCGAVTACPRIEPFPENAGDAVRQKLSASLQLPPMPSSARNSFTAGDTQQQHPRELSLSGNAVCEAAECLHIVLECWKEDSVDDGGRRCAGCAAPAARTSAKRLLFLCVSHELQDVTLLQPELGIDRTAIHSVLASSASPSFPPAASAAAAAFGRAAYFVSREDSGATSLGSVAYILFRHVQKARRIQQGNQGAFLAASTTRVEDTLEAHRREVVLLRQQQQQQLRSVHNQWLHALCQQTLTWEQRQQQEEQHEATLQRLWAAHRQQQREFALRHRLAMESDGEETLRQQMQQQQHAPETAQHFVVAISVKQLPWLLAALEHAAAAARCPAANTSGAPLPLPAFSLHEAARWFSFVQNRNTRGCGASTRERTARHCAGGVSWPSRILSSLCSRAPNHSSASE